MDPWIRRPKREPATCGYTTQWGFILFRGIRRYARERVDPALRDDMRASVQKGIDGALDGLTIAIDRVTDGLSTAGYAVSIDRIARLARRGDSGNRAGLSGVDLRPGEGLCTAYGGWLESDFGEHSGAGASPRASHRPNQTFHLAAAHSGRRRRPMPSGKRDRKRAESACYHLG